jgi:hypothetical protein
MLPTPSRVCSESGNLAELLDPDTAASCTFGTWASCRVGQNLRDEDLPE